jgi:hypothetical protein
VNTFANPFQDVLDPGERLLWSGQPKQGVLLQPRDALMIPFSLMWGGFAVFWETMALNIPRHTHAGAQPPGAIAWIFPLWGIPFVLIGLYIIFGRFFYDAAVRKRTYYGITNQRLIILKTFFSRTLASYSYPTLAALNLSERGDKSGDIAFGNPNPMASFSGAGWPGTGRYAVPGFYLLPDARQVYNRIREAQKQAG